MSEDQDLAIDEWRIAETSFDPDRHALHETLFALGNGYIGLRGSIDEGLPQHGVDGSYLNGFFETQPIDYPENAHGLARHNQFMLNVPNGKRIELWLDDERLDLREGRILRYERSLDFREGVLRRHLKWHSPGGRSVELTSERLVCLQRRQVYAARCSVKPLNFEGRLTLRSSLDARVRNVQAGDDPRVGTHAGAQPPLQWIEARQTASGLRLLHRTRRSGFLLVSEVEHEIAGGRELLPTRESLDGGQCLAHGWAVRLREGESVALGKFGAYHSTRDFPERELLQRSAQALADARAAGFDALVEEQREALAAFWRDADVQIGGDAALQQGMRFNLYHLLQSTGRDGRTNIAAKGVTGEGYEGHSFWDTEIYVFPLFLATQPQVARALLSWRWAGLGAARERARQMAHPKGALYPWRTIAGEECSAYFPAGTAQVHINADIAYAIKQYLDATGDEKFLREQGAEMVMETARIWLQLGHHDPRRDGAFCIHEVTGPDEYTAMVSNNFYTNAMAQLHLAYAATVAERLRRKYPRDFARIAAAMALEDDEPHAWQRAAEAMYLPLDERLGIHPQDDSFLHKPVWDFANTPKSHYPLLLHYHPLVIYRHQVCKQADVLLALLLRTDRFTLEQKRRDFDYYEPLTTHDSSLSACIFSIIASEVGYRDKAYAYFMHTARMDLDDEHGNTQHGVHTAAMAGTWLAVVHGFAGLRRIDGQPRFNPVLPAHWTHYGFKLRIKGRQIEVQVRPGEAEYTLLEGDSLEFRHGEDTLRLSSRQPSLVLPLAAHA
jgi:alpha,alpha-trehalose phosphorylase